MISLRSVTKQYAPGTVAVDNLSLEIDEGELCVLVGPSGCGKTTTLKMINRLIEPSSGEVLVDGENVMDADPVQLRRRIGYVMQHGGLFPHIRVADNVGVVPKLLGWTKPAVAARVQELLELVGLDPSRYGSRYPHELSGGERQRVGVARALGGDPPVLLMDEPFGAVDPITRKRLQEEFAELHQTLKKTVVLVTHDINEAVRLGTRIAIFRSGGVLEQHATPADLLGHPATAFVADFIGADRGLERLEVTDINPLDLSVFPTVEVTTPASRAAEQMADAQSYYAVVVDERGVARGWLSIADAAAQGDDTPVARFARPIESRVAITASLRSALSTLLDHDAGFVVVEDNDRFVGALTLTDLHSAMRRAVGGMPDTVAH